AHIVSIQGHALGSTPAHLATDTGSELHSGQAPRVYPDGNGMDQLPSPSVQGWRTALWRSDAFERRLPGSALPGLDAHNAQRLDSNRQKILSVALRVRFR